MMVRDGEVVQGADALVPQELHAAVIGAIESYRVGALARARSNLDSGATASRRPPYVDVTEEGASAWWSERDFIGMRPALHAHGRALELVRMGDGRSARMALREAYERFDPSAVSQAARVMMRTLHEAAAAYVDYKLGDMESACARMMNSIEETIRMHDEFAWPHATPRLIHLAQNVIRVQLRAGNYEEGLRVAASILACTAGGMSHWPFAEPAEELPPVPSSTAVAASLKTMVEVAEAVATNSIIRPLVLSAFRHALERPSEYPEERCGAALLWLRIQRHAHLSGPEVFLRAIAELLGNDAPHTTSFLWHSAVRDFVQHCTVAYPELSDWLYAEVMMVYPSATRVPAVFLPFGTPATREAITAAQPSFDPQRSRL